MTTTKFKTRFANQYMIEIFGNQDFTEPLLTKNLSQKVKFQLKKIGNSLQKEYKDVMTEVQDLFLKYSEDVPVEEGQEAPKEPKKRIKEEFKEQFLKETKELEDMDIAIQHEPFVERDFIDRGTGDIVGGNVYYNLIDLFLWDKEQQEEEEAAQVE